MMTFSFDASLSSDTNLVRFHIGDTNDDGHFLEDETIDYWVAESTTIEEAVIRCIQYIITQLSTPNFKLDWLSVSTDKARVGYEKMLKQKRQEFGIQTASFSSSISLPYRADSDQDSDTAYGE